MVTGGRRRGFARRDRLRGREGGDRLHRAVHRDLSAALLVAAGIGFALVGGTLTWAVAPWILGAVLMAMAVTAGVSGTGTLYGLTLHRGRSEQIVWYSRDRHLVDRMAEQIRAICI